MAELLFNKDRFLTAWVAKKIPHMSGGSFGGARAIGVVTGFSPRDRLLAAIVLHDYHPRYRTIQLSAASAGDPRWASRKVFREVLAYPFLQYGVNKVWVAIPHNLKRVIAFNKRIGFQQEAVLRDHFGPGKHAVILRMLAQDYDRLYLEPVRLRGEEAA